MEIETIISLSNHAHDMMNHYEQLVVYGAYNNPHKPGYDPSNDKLNFDKWKVRFSKLNIMVESYFDAHIDTLPND